ncbi:MAG: V-type ATPase subunit [Chromatiales bacterium]|jgi:V/A-type H+-transporting ATPase subunit C
MAHSATLPRSEAYLATRVTIMSGRLMDADAIGAMVDRPLSQIPRLEGFSELMERQATGSARSRAVENALIRMLLAECTIILRAITGDLRQLFTFWARRFELFNLKALIRGKLHGLDPATIEDNLYDLPPYTTLPKERLLQAESVTELLKLLEATPYGDIARQARLAFEDRAEALYLDATIDRRYFQGLVKRVDRLEDRHREPLRRLVRGLVDHTNLIWLLRYRFSYGLSPAETYYVLIPHGLRLDRALLQRLCGLPDPRAVLAQLPQRLRDALGSAGSAVAVERALERHYRDTAQAHLSSNASAPARAFAYLLLREIDLKRLQAVIQGKSLQLAPELVREALGLKGDEAGPARDRAP